MRVDLAADPAVIGIAATLNIHEDVVVGKLHRLWSWAALHLADGAAPNVAPAWVDKFLGRKGFAAAMTAQGWLLEVGAGISFPKFTRWNSECAKRRLEKTNRQRRWRDGRVDGGAPTDVDADVDDIASTDAPTCTAGVDGGEGMSGDAESRAPAPPRTRPARTPAHVSCARVGPQGIQGADVDAPASTNSSTRRDETIRDERKEQQPPLPPGGGTGAEAPSPAGSNHASEIATVIGHYRRHHPAFRGGEKERAKIRARLKEGWTVDQICAAIDGYHRSPFHCGENDRGKKYLALELMVRDAGHVQAGIEVPEHGAPVLSEQTLRSVRAAEAFIAAGRTHDQQ